MSMTLAHTAIASPLWRLTGRRLVLSAVVVGAMSPDFEYLVRLAPVRTISHTPLGVVVFCVPASVAVLGAWHRLVGPAFAPLLPGELGAAAARPFPLGPARRMLAIAASAAVGAATHLVWDSFTHAPSPVVARLGVLSGPAWAGGPPGYVIAWWVGTIAGSAAIAGWLLRQAGVLRRSGQPASLLRLRRRTGVAIAAGGVAAAGLNAARDAAAGAAPGQVLVAAVLGAMTGTALAAVAAGAVLRARPAR